MIQSSLRKGMLHLTVWFWKYSFSSISIVGGRDSFKDSFNRSFPSASVFGLLEWHSLGSPAVRTLGLTSVLGSFLLVSYLPLYLLSWVVIRSHRQRGILLLVAVYGVPFVHSTPSELLSAFSHDVFCHRVAAWLVAIIPRLYWKAFNFLFGIYALQFIAFERLKFLEDFIVGRYNRPFLRSAETYFTKNINFELNDVRKTSVEIVSRSMANELGISTLLILC